MLPPNQHIASMLKQQRAQRSWSLDTTAKKTGVSKAMLGQIERGESSPTIATLWKITAGFECSLTSFIEPRSTEPALLRQADELRHQITSDSILVAPLFPFDEVLGFEMFELTLQPNYEHLSEPHLKGTIEHIVVIKGEMDVLIDGQWVFMRTGSAIRFNADVRHGYRNLTQATAVFHNIIHYAAMP
jgi:transcriptional regulator with XRE-family HTH domain